MYVLALAESKEQILLAQNIIVRRESPTYSYSYGYRQPSYLSARYDTFDIEFIDVLMMEEPPGVIEKGRYSELPPLLFHQERTSYGHLITGGWITDTQYSGSPICNGTFHFNKIGIRCYEVTGCDLSAVHTNLSSDEKEVLRHIIIYTKEHND